MFYPSPLSDHTFARCAAENKRWKKYANERENIQNSN